MKTPEEIKKGLGLCSKAHSNICGKCPYNCDSSRCIRYMVKDALAYIQQLEGHIGDLTNMAPRWISVKEREPEHNGLYYCHTDMWGDIMCRCIDKSWLDNKATFANFPRRPTHWLEIPKIPKPPKEDKNVT
nr:MAG TPA: Protein of unknown function (DUF551) [Caudoviricetes sp.]